jgi:hypothetical protein
MLAGPLNQVASLHYEGGKWHNPHFSSVPPPQNPPITLQRLSRVSFHHVDISSLFLNATAPSLTTLYLNNSLPSGSPSRPAQSICTASTAFANNRLIFKSGAFDAASVFAAGPAHAEYCEYSGDGGGLLVQALINTNRSSTFPKLQELMLQYVPTPPQVFECLLQSLPASTATVALVECPQSDIIPIDLIKACHNINLSVQLPEY